MAPCHRGSGLPIHPILCTFVCKVFMIKILSLSNRLIMLQALGRKYICRSRTGNHGLYLLLSQFSSSSGSTSTRSPALGQGTILSPTPNNPLFPIVHHHPRFNFDLFFKSLRRFEEPFDEDDGYCGPAEAVAASLRRIHRHQFRPSVPFLLQVLSIFGSNANKLSSFLAIFEWAGQQPDFRHTPETFDALNSILAGLNPNLFRDLVNVLDFGRYWARFYNTLLVAYLIARVPGLVGNILVDVSLTGSITPAAFNALVSVLLQHKLFAEADEVLNCMLRNGQISLEPNKIINRDRLRELVLHSGNQVEGRFIGGHALITLVRDHCENKRFEDATDLIDEFNELSSFKSNYPFEQSSFEVWLKSVRNYAESCSAAPKFAALSDQMQTAHEACNPDVIHYTLSLFQLVRENMFEEASQLLMEMKELQFMPRKSVVSQLMCYLIKAGALHIALGLYKLRPDESQSSMHHYFLLNLLCGCGCNSNKISCILAGSPNCCKVDRLIRVLRFRPLSHPDAAWLPATFRNFLYNKLVSALCRAGRVEDAYLLHGEFNLTRHKVFVAEPWYQVTSTSEETYYHMIYGFRRINREDVADRLLLEMQELPNRRIELEGVLS